MSGKSGKDIFGWQTSESVLETTAVCDLAAYLFDPEYRKLGSERHRAKARIRSTIARAMEKGKLAPPISLSPKSLDVKNLLRFACARWPKLRDVIFVIDTCAEVSSAPCMEIELGSVTVEIDNVPSTYPELYSHYQSLRVAYREEKSRRIAAQSELKKLRCRHVQRRLNGAKRYE